LVLAKSRDGVLTGESVVLQAVIKLLSARNIRAPGDPLPLRA
jgi:hypothetical protein